MAKRMGEDREAFDGESLAAYVATLFPMQQQAIATAQLAGCRFERRSYERFAGVPVRGSSRWITTTEYEVFLPDGTSAGTGEDIYECALIALSIMDTPPPSPSEKALSQGAFRLDPWNEQE